LLSVIGETVLESKEATQKGEQGEIFVFNYLQEKGYNPEWVKSGYDIKAIVDGKERRIEVKTTKNLKPTIPDMNITEFEGTLDKIPCTGKMKATHIYVVTGWGEGVEHKIFELDTKLIEEHVKSSPKNWLRIKYRVTGARLNKLCQKYAVEIN